MLNEALYTFSAWSGQLLQYCHPFWPLIPTNSLSALLTHWTAHVYTIFAYMHLRWIPFFSNTNITLISITVPSVFHVHTNTLLRWGHKPSSLPQTLLTRFISLLAWMHSLHLRIKSFQLKIQIWDSNMGTMVLKVKFLVSCTTSVGRFWFTG